MAVLALVVGGGLFVRHRSDVADAKREAAAHAAQVKKKEVEEKAAAAAAEKAAALQEEQDTYDACASELTPFFDSLSKVDARLDVGLSQDEFSDLVGDASVSYNKLDAQELGQGWCLNTGANLEDALNKYIETAAQWNDCIYDAYCDTDSIEPAMQTKWTRASTLIDKAGDALKTNNPANANA